MKGGEFQSFSSTTAMQADNQDFLPEVTASE
jgi:hypothetical protein